MLRSSVRIVLLGLIAAISSATAQSIKFTDLSGHVIEYDLITLSVQTQVEAIVPVVNAVADEDIASLSSAWIKTFQASATAGTMTVKQNADNLSAFLTTAAATSPSFASSAKTALSKSGLDFFKFHSFLPAATWDVVDYGIVLARLPFNATLLGQVRDFMAKNVNTKTKEELQNVLDSYLAVQEKTTTGFKTAIYKQLDAVYRAVWVNNPTRAPTSSPSSTTSTPTTTTATTSATINPSTKPTSGSSSSSTEAADVTLSPELYIGEPMPVEASSTAPPTSAPTPAPTTSSASVVAWSASAVATTLVLAVASAIL